MSDSSYGWLANDIRQATVIKRVKAFVASKPSYVVYDFETTGIDTKESRIVSVGIVDSLGNVVLDEIVNPLIPIPEGASNIHGITDDVVQGKPTFIDIYPRIFELMNGKTWVGYNIKGYDNNILASECARYGLPMPTMGSPVDIATKSIPDNNRIDCFDMMLEYSQYKGNWYRGSWKWQKLVVARDEFGVETGEAHNAVVDALATYHLMHKMAKHADEGLVQTRLKIGDFKL